MNFNTNEQRKAEFLYKEREEKDRRNGAYQSTLKQQSVEQIQNKNLDQLYGKYRLKQSTSSLNQSNLSKNTTITNTQNNKYLGDVRQNEGLFKDYHKLYEDKENYENVNRKVKSKSLHNLFQDVLNNQMSYQQASINDVVKNEVEQMIQEKINANIGNFFSLDKIKQRFAEMQQRSQSQKNQQFEPKIQNIQMRYEEKTVNHIQSNKQQLYKNQSQPSFEKYINPITQQYHQIQIQEKNNSPQMKNQKDERLNIIKPQNNFEKKRAQSSHQQGKHEIKHQQIDFTKSMKDKLRDQQLLQPEQNLPEKKRCNSYILRKPEQENIQQNKYHQKQQINEIPNHVYCDNDKLKTHRYEQWERILKDKIENFASRDNQKILQQQKEIQEKCTFVPQINEVSKQIMANKENDLNVQDRLYKDGMMKQQKREELKRKYEDSQPYTYKPNVQESIQALKGNAFFTKPLHERLDDVIKQRQENIIQLQIKNQNESQYPFKPQLNQKSEIIASEKLDGKNVIQRLLNSAHDKEQRRSKMAISHHESVSQMCTFQPSINPSNRDYINDEYNDRYYSQQQRQEEFFQKQHLAADNLKEKLVQKIKDTYKNSEFTFKPEINQVSKYLVAADNERAAETKDDKIYRLHEYDYLKRLIVQQQIQQSYYDQFQFKPEINPLSRQLARQVSVDSLAQNKIQKSKKMKEFVEKQKMKECSFQPMTNKNRMYENIKSTYSKERIQHSVYEEKQSRENHIMQLKQQVILNQINFKLYVQ